MKSGVNSIFKLILIFATIATAARVAAATATATATATAGAETEVISVETVTVTEGDIREVLQLTGEVKPLVEHFLTADVSAQVTEILVANGQRVETGEVLIVLDSSRFEIALRQAEAAYGAAQRRAREAENNFKRNRVLFDSKVINEKTFEAVETMYLEASYAMLQSQAARDQAQLNLKRTKIIAPFTGWFVNRSVQPGQMVSPGMLLGKLINLTRVLVEIKVSESRIGNISLGQQVLLEGGQTAVVNQIDLYADSSRAFLVTLLADNPQQIYKANMFIRGELILAAYEDVPLLPARALISDSTGSSVFVVEVDSAIARRRNLNISAREGKWVYSPEIAAGEQLVVTGQFELKEGSLVQIISSTGK